jgi:hypothetical protein
MNDREPFQKTRLLPTAPRAHPLPFVGLGGSCFGLCSASTHAGSVEKALGLVTASAAQDASITFSSAFSFDFDRSDGLAGSSSDFVVSCHEIGHSLGF